jgi:hypothetical protein
MDNKEESLILLSTVLKKEAIFVWFTLVRQRWDHFWQCYHVPQSAAFQELIIKWLLTQSDYHTSIHEFKKTNLRKLHGKREECVFVPIFIEPNFWSMFYTVIRGETIVHTCTKTRYKVDRCLELCNWYDITHPSTIWVLCSFKYVQLSTWFTITSTLWNDVKVIDIGEEAVLPWPIRASFSNRTQNQPNFTNSVPWDLIIRIISTAGEKNVPWRPSAGHEHLAFLFTMTGSYWPQVQTPEGGEQFRVWAGHMTLIIWKSVSCNWSLNQVFRMEVKQWV